MLLIAFDSDKVFVADLTLKQHTLRQVQATDLLMTVPGSWVREVFPTFLALERPGGSVFGAYMVVQVTGHLVRHSTLTALKGTSARVDTHVNL